MTDSDSDSDSGSRRIERSRQLDDADALSSFEPGSSASGRRLLAQVFDGGNFPTTTDSWVLTNPGVVDGTEIEGGPASLTADTAAVVPVLIIGAGLPAPGDWVLAKMIGGKWVAEHVATGNCCDRWFCRGPYPLYVDVTDPLYGTFRLPRVAGSCDVFQLQTTLPFAGWNGCPAATIPVCMTITPVVLTDETVYRFIIAFSGTSNASNQASCATGPGCVSNPIVFLCPGNFQGPPGPNGPCWWNDPTPNGTLPITLRCDGSNPWAQSIDYHVLSTAYGTGFENPFYALYQGPCPIDIAPPGVCYGNLILTWKFNAPLTAACGDCENCLTTRSNLAWTSTGLGAITLKNYGAYGWYWNSSPALYEVRVSCSVAGTAITIMKLINGSFQTVASTAAGSGISKIAITNFVCSPPDITASITGPTFDGDTITITAQ